MSNHSFNNEAKGFHKKSWFKIKQPVFFSLIAILAGCTSITTRTYDLPAKYVGFAAQEACLTAGFEVKASMRSNEPIIQITGTRPLNVGLFVGQGNESVVVNVSGMGSTTSVHIESNKHFIAFGAQRHMDERIASYLDDYLKENIALKDLIVGKSEE